MDLKYLFKAEYTDGTSFSQTPDDVSSLDPNKSQFFDVLNSGKKLLTFSLQSDDVNVSVNLQNGLFSINGVEFEVGDQLPAEKQRELVFFRRHTHEYNAVTNEELSHQITYLIGWQVNIAKKNYQRMIGIK